MVGAVQKQQKEVNTKHTLLSDKIANRLGLGRINKQYAPFLFVLIGILAGGAVSLLFSDKYTLLEPDTLRPWSVTYHGSLIVGLLLAIYLRDAYDYYINQLPISEEKREYFKPVVPMYISAGILLTGILFHFGYFFGIGEIENVYDFEGVLSGTIKIGIIIPFVYLVVIVDLLSVVIGITFLLPYRVKQSDLDLDFTDIRNIHGMRPIGLIIKRASQLYFIALLLFTLFVVQKLVQFDPLDPASTSLIQDPGLAVTNLTIFYMFVGWMTGVVIFMIPVVWTHRYMRQKKQETLAQLEDEIKQKKKSSDGLDGISEIPEEPGEYRDAVYLYTAMNRVEKASEYPVDFKIIRNILLIAILPLIVNIITYFITNYVI